MLETITTLLQPWADLYGDSKVLSTALIAIHVLSMFVGGGIAVAGDRRVLMSAPGTPDAYRAVAEDVKALHGVVIASMVLMVLSGLLLAASDFGTFGVSLVFWSKMATFGVLSINGLAIRRSEQRVLNAAQSTTEFSVIGKDLEFPWISLRRGSWISVACWLLTVFLGVLLTNS
jgi:hypothetical protein